MSELRWILLAAGAVLIVGIFVYGRIAARRAGPPAQRMEPSLPAAEADGAISSTPRPPEPSAAPEVFDQTDLPLPEAQPREEVAAGNGDATKLEEKVIAIHIAARGERRFRGPDLLAAFEAESLEFGDFEIFHRRTGNRSIFSISSMVEPGTFDPDSMDQFSTPGLSMFMIIPGPESPVGAFTEMLSTARRIATMLDGEVLDESGSTLSRQAASHLREQIIDFAHRVR